VVVANTNNANNTSVFQGIRTLFMIIQHCRNILLQMVTNDLWNWKD